MNYKGNVHQMFFEVLKKNDGFDVGAKLTQIEKTAKKRFMSMSDQEVYESMEKYVIATEEEKDNPLTETEFMGWINNSIPESNERIFIGNSRLIKI